MNERLIDEELHVEHVAKEASLGFLAMKLGAIEGSLLAAIVGFLISWTFKTGFAPVVLGVLGSGLGFYLAIKAQSPSLARYLGYGSAAATVVTLLALGSSLAEAFAGALASPIGEELGFSTACFLFTLTLPRSAGTFGFKTAAVSFIYTAGGTLVENLSAVAAGTLIGLLLSLNSPATPTIAFSLFFFFLVSAGILQSRSIRWADRHLRSTGIFWRSHIENDIATVWFYWGANEVQYMRRYRRHPDGTWEMVDDRPPP